MDKKIIAVISTSIAFVLSLSMNVYLGKKLDKLESLGANSQFGMPCIFTSSARTLVNGEGTAFTCDSEGKLVITN